MLSSKLTASRRKSLEVVADTYPTSARVSTSNSTEHGTVSSAGAAWLRKMGWAQGDGQVMLTPAGLEAVEVHLERRLDTPAGAALDNGDRPPGAVPVVEQIVSIPASQLRPGQTGRDKGDLDGLATSIRSHGILEPLIVTKPPDGDGWVIVAGHRRHAAAVVAGLDEVPCVIRKLDDPALDEVRLIENLQRHDLDPLEEAAAYKRLLARKGYSQRKLAERVGVSQPHISRRVALLRLPPAALEALEQQQMTVEDAVELAKLTDHPDLLTQALDRGLGSPHTTVAAQAQMRLRQLERERQREAEEDRLRKAGVKIIDRDEVRWSPHGNHPCRLRQVARDRQVSEDEHEGMPCHAVTFDVSEHVAVCLEPQSHPNRQMELAGEDEQQVRRREEAEARRQVEEEARAARRAAIIRAVELVDVRTALRETWAIALNAGLVIGLTHATDFQACCDAAGVDYSDELPPLEALRAATADPTTGARVLLAVVLTDTLALLEDGFRGWESEDRRRELDAFDDATTLLEQAGWELTELELAKLGELRQDLDDTGGTDDA